MSTRSQIAVMKEDGEKDLNKCSTLIYRHSDGYPIGVMPNIMPFLEWWANGRGMDDTEYLGARLVQYLCNKHDEFVLMFNQEMPMRNAEQEKENLEKWGGTLGYGICNKETAYKGWHGDIEFVYAIYPSKVVVYECDFDFDGGTDINKRVHKLTEVKIGTWNEAKFAKKLEALKEKKIKSQLKED